MGASLAQLKRMRKNVKDATAFAGTWACTATVIAWLFGPTADPMVQCPTEQLDAWLTAWRTITTQDRHDTRFTWHQHLVTLLTNQKPLNGKGPAAATINAITMAGWKPSRPDLWKIDNATTIELNNDPALAAAVYPGNDLGQAARLVFRLIHRA